MKRFCILIIATSLSLAAFCQSPTPKTNGQIDDQRKADAGKADVISTRNRNIFDSTTFNNTSESAGKKTVKAATKRKVVGRKCKRVR